MIRILQILVLLALAWLIWRMVRAALAPRSGEERRETPRFTPTARCPRCGTHVPREQLNAAGLCPRCAPASN